MAGEEAASLAALNQSVRALVEQLREINGHLTDAGWGKDTPRPGPHLGEEERDPKTGAQD